ncbi:Ankyrin repeat domain-containing protein 50 [Fusarium oxysporum f. sp. albedinis]|nr:Ankyrin repeat domain-containing protein 50 [Fusarium oxysporum f. sp. albedinis]
MSDPNIEARILLALHALQNDPELSLRRAAGIYQVRYWTLHRRQKGILSTRDSIPKSRKLSDLEEQILVQFILDLDSRGFPPRLRCVEEMANRLLADRETPPVGKRWASNFVKRHKDLKTRFFRKYDYQRAKCEDPTVIRNWFMLVENTIAKYGIQSHDIWNFDETGFIMGMISIGMVVTAINAEGQAIEPFIIGAGQNHLANWHEERTLPCDWVIAMSQNGWTNNKRGLEWLKHFDRRTADRSVGSYRLLILDGHESHHSVEFERYCEANKIITLCKPAHASHLLQPLDIGCFGPLKTAYGREIEHLIRRSIRHISKTEFFPAFVAAFQATMTEKNIRGSFRGADLVPFDPESVISNLDVQLRTPTPPVEEASQAQPWTSKTPMTVLEAEYQSEYLNRRIRRHKSSSPESILGALKSLAKGTKAIMHENALLRAELREVREANEILSRRRRVKRIRLQKRGVMTVGEARDLIDQMGVDMQVVVLNVGGFTLNFRIKVQD